jgi:AAA family ATP:ADP antiporter
MGQTTTYGSETAAQMAGDTRVEAQDSTGASRPSLLERGLGLFTTVRAGEGASALLFFAYAFLMLVAYYILRTIREPLLLGNGSAELKSYACAAIAGVLLVLVPFYSVLFRRTDRHQLIRWVTVLFAAQLVPFYLLGRAGVDVGFVYYVWVGVFSVTMLTQFWAHAAHSFKTESGQRLLPVIMAGATLGGLTGPKVSSALYAALGEWNLMLLAMALLLATLPLVEWTSNSVPQHARKVEPGVDVGRSHPLGGFALVFRDRYLMLLALLAVLLNCVNTTGEYVLTAFVTTNADLQVAADPSLDRKAIIAAFFGDYYFATNALGVILQLFFVARIFRWIGVHGALLVLPIVALIGYGLVVFLPVFGMIRVVKILENSTNYTVMNTARHAVYLPLPAAHQYEGKTAVDTFFWRLGDVAQAGVIYVGLNWLDLGFQHFALLNLLLSAVWILVAVQIGKRYTRETVRRFKINWRAVVVGASAATFAVAAFAVPRGASAGEAQLFSGHEPLAIELVMDGKALCRGERTDCANAPATLIYREPDGAERRVDVELEARGKWRNSDGHCSVPPLFVHFSAAAAGTLFDGESMLPLTTHCREKPSSYEQYVLKEYLAYRIYNALTDKSLRVRLVRVTYRDARRDRSVERYGFFTEHFNALAARHGAAVRDAEDFHPFEADPLELATFELFEYMIGNTDWSAVRGHNAVYIGAADGAVTAVPFDFDFSGLVDASYAGPPPQLPISSVTERLFRGFCRPGFDSEALFQRFRDARGSIDELVASIPGLDAEHREKAEAYLAEFFAILDSPERREKDILGACRANPA